MFSGDNTGLVIAEIELRHEHQQFTQPRWLGQEVTGQSRYYNRALAQRPFRGWSEPQASATAEPTQS